MADTRSLAVYMNGDRVATWSVHRGIHELSYDSNWTALAHARPVSLSLPFLPGGRPHRGEVVRTFFENLLPDRLEVRNRLRDRFRAASAGAFDLLAEIGRDCVGAIQLLPPGVESPPVRKIEGERLSSDQIARHLEIAGGLRLPGFDLDDFRISLAGAQEKTAFLRHNGVWHKPVGATPSTHIVKLPLGGIGGIERLGAGSVENEWLCSRIVAAFGLPVAETQIARFATKRVLIVTRFDRRRSDDGKWWVRLPTEDFCQVKGVPPEKKYEADGGPGIDDILKVLEGSEHPTEERERFLKTQIVLWLLAAPDGHAKNFSIFLGPQGTYRMTPLYDVLSVYPWIGDGIDRIPVQKLKMAMAVRGKSSHYRWNTIHRRHWEEVARRNGLQSAIGRLIRELVERTPEVIRNVESELPSNFPEDVADSIFSGMRRAVDRLATE